METQNHQHYLDTAKYIVEASVGYKGYDKLYHSTRLLDQHLRVAGYHLSQGVLEKYIMLAQKESMLKTEKQLICVGIAKRIIKDNQHMVYSALYNLVQQTILLSGYDNTWYNVTKYIEEAREELAKEKNTMKLTIGGVTIEGTEQEIAQFATKHGLKLEGTYKSDTRGIIFIRDMDTNHIRNAVVKKNKLWSESLTGLSAVDLLRSLRDGNNDVEFLDLIRELAKRV